MKMSMRILLLCGAVMMTASCAGAQAAMQEGNTPKAGTMEAPAKALDAMLAAYEEEAMGVAKEMPADKFNFVPPSMPGTKFEGVRSFAAQIIHLTQANYFFYATAASMKPDVDMKAIGNLKTKEEIVAAFAASFVFAHKAIATITAANAFEAIKPVDGQTTRATLAAFAVAHGFDHYGQMVEYLRMNGLVPPGSK